MDRFSRQISQLKAAIARSEVAPALLLLGALPGAALFSLLGAQMMTSLLAGLAVGMLLIGAILSAAMPSIWSQQRATLISAALLAYACGTHAAIYRLVLPSDQAAAFDQMAGLAILSLGALAAVGHAIWRAIPRR
ncbi:hypothetical protein EKD04_008520 [Chloroflexales bacterium ZM16-3]|nr:hypothetical protein [Chloroflexales bacterium ZM16-3]